MIHVSLILVQHFFRNILLGSIQINYKYKCRGQPDGNNGVVMPQRFYLKHHILSKPFIKVYRVYKRILLLITNVIEFMIKNETKQSAGIDTVKNIIFAYLNDHLSKEIDITCKLYHTYDVKML